MHPNETLIAESLDWQATGLVRAGDAACDVAAYLGWRRNHPAAGYTASHVAAIRAAASDEQRRAAEDKLGEAFRNLPETCPRVILRGVSEMDFFLGATRDNLLAFGEGIDRDTKKWDHTWGNAGFMARYIPMVLAIPECPDAALVPALAWMLRTSDYEWNWSRTWDETMLGTAGHNWWLHTWLGLFSVASFFPEFTQVRRFQALGKSFLESEIRLSTLPDGFSRERSGYHWGIVDDWLRVWNLQRLGHVTFSAGFNERFGAIAATLWKTAVPNGSVPRWGDTGASYGEGSVLELLRVAAAVTGQGELKYVARKMDPKWQPPLPGLWPAFGLNLLPAYEAVRPRKPSGPTADTVLPQSAYYLMRTGWTRGDDAITVDAGAFGNAVTSHGHTHVFPLEFFVKGEPVLVDNCSGPYDDSAARRWRVGSSAHNVAMVDGQDHVPVVSEWRWDRPIMPEVLEWRSRPRYAYFVGAHEGYTRLPEPVTAARRSVFWLRGGYAIVTDRFTAPGTAGHLYTVHFHLRGDVNRRNERLVTASTSRGRLAVYGVPGCSGPFTLEPCPHPLPEYDNPAHAWHELRCAGNVTMVTLLVPYEGAEPDVCARPIDVTADGRVLSPFEATGLEIIVNGRRDVFVEMHMRWVLPWSAGGFSGTDSVFHSETAEEGHGG